MTHEVNAGTDYTSARAVAQADADRDQTPRAMYRATGTGGSGSDEPRSFLTERDWTVEHFAVIRPARRAAYMVSGVVLAGSRNREPCVP